MTHVEKFLLRAVNPTTREVIREKWVYDRHTAECFAADWHMHPKTRTANIYVGKDLIYGYDPLMPRPMSELEEILACFLPDDYQSDPPIGHITTANAKDLFGWRPGSGESVGEAAQRKAQQERNGIDLMPGNAGQSTS